MTGWSYWALVLKPMVLLVFTAIGVWICCPWIPGRARIDDDVRQMLRFGRGITGFSVTDLMTRSADRLAIGYVYGPGPLGYFQNAMLIHSNLLVILVESLHNVAVAGFTRLRDDVAALQRAWAAGMSLMTFVSAGVFATLTVTGTDFVVLLFGEKWAPAGPMLCVLALRGIAQSVERAHGWLHVTAGRTDAWMRWGGISAVVQLLALAVGLPFGTMGVLVAYAIAIFALAVPSLVYAGQPYGIGPRQVLTVVGPPVVAALAAAWLGYAFQQSYLTDLSRLARIVISAPACVSIYLLILVGVFRVTQPIKYATSLLTDLAQKLGRS
jgi:PST family polysaccharide transporter